MYRIAHSGLNRVTWDMRYDHLTPVVLQTIPPEDPNIWNETRFKGRRARPVTHWGMPDIVAGPLAVPGAYTVRLTVNGKTLSAPLQVLRDPNSETNQAGMDATLALQLRIAHDVHQVADMVNLTEEMRVPLQALEKKYAGNAKMERELQTMDKKIQKVEYTLFSRYLAPSDDKYYQSAYKVYYNLLWLNAEIGTGAGDVAGGADFGPTDIEPKLLAIIETHLAKGAADFQNLVTKEVPGFNSTLEGRDIAPLPTKLQPVPNLLTLYPARELEEAYAN
jgi:hypothetical protein